MSHPEQPPSDRPTPVTPDSGMIPVDVTTLLAAAAERIVAGDSAEVFLDWFAAEAPALAPALGDWLRITRGESLDRGFGRALWNRFPRPETRLRPRPLPAVGRNDPCPCGSGAKHKRCCLAEAPSVETLAHLPLLLHVLDALPDDALDDLDITAADPDELLEALDVWGEEGAGERVVRLVAPLFEADGTAGARRLPRHAPELLEALFEHWPPGYLEPRLVALGERFSAHRDETLASVAILARVRARLDEPELARALLKAGRHRFPDDPGLDEIEIDLLNAEGRIDEAVRLAETLGERLLRDDPDDPARVDHAESLLERATWIDPEDALALDRAEDDVLDRLIVLLEETPPAPIAGSHAGIGPGRELVLEPSAPLAAVEAAWTERFGTGPSIPPASGAPDPTSADSIPEEDDALTRVVGYLDDEPLALSSFRVLAALARGVGDWEREPWADALRVRVLERGEALLYRHVSREAGFETPRGLPDWDTMIWDTAPRVPSACAANREALELLAGLARWHRHAGPSPEDRSTTLSAALHGLDRPA